MTSSYHSVKLGYFNINEKVYMKKTDVKNIAGGTKTTVTGPDGSKTITYNGVNNLHIGRTFTYGARQRWSVHALLSLSP